MNAAAIHASRNALLLRRRVVRGLAIGLAAALVLAFTGAFGTFAAPFTHRLAYWAAVILPGSLLGLAVQAIVSDWGGLARKPAGEIVLVALLVSIPHCFLVIVASALFFGQAAITPALVFSFWLSVLLIALVLTAINRLAAAPLPEPVLPPFEPVPLPAAEPAATALSEPEPTSPPPSPPALPDLIAEKLPDRLRGARLLAIEAEDHYLRIHTEAGSDLVLMRMGDVCALLPDAAGARVHRSWWVAKAAVTGRTRQAGKMELTLSGGLNIPVSRAMQARLREDGWR